MSFKTAFLFGAAALCCVRCFARAQSADDRLRAIYTEEWKWRLEQFPGLEGVEKPVPDRLPKVDPATLLAGCVAQARRCSARAAERRHSG
jgi:hypothetical protein